MFYTTDPSLGSPVYMVDIIIGRDTCIKGWVKSDKDLNSGAEGEDLFITLYSTDRSLQFHKWMIKKADSVNQSRLFRYVK